MIAPHAYQHGWVNVQAATTSERMQHVGTEVPSMMCCIENTMIIDDEATNPGVPPPDIRETLPRAFPLSASVPETSGFAKQPACPGFDLVSSRRLQLPLQLRFTYKDVYQYFNANGTVRDSVYSTTLKLYIHADGTTNAGVSWHGRAWHGAWQWLVPQQTLQIRFHHSGSDKRSYVHSFELEASCHSRAALLQNNRSFFAFHRPVRGDCFNRFSSLELNRTRALFENGWKDCSADPLFDIVLEPTSRCRIGSDDGLVQPSTLNAVCALECIS